MIYFAKKHPDAIIPSKRDEDAGYDFFPCIEKEMVIEPMQTVKVPLGVASAFDPAYVLILKERSSTGKYGLSLRSGVVDSGYRGEIMALLTNASNKPYIIKPGKAIVQGVLVQLAPSMAKEISLEELMAMDSQRKESGFGSTDIA